MKIALNKLYKFFFKSLSRKFFIFTILIILLPLTFSTIYFYKSLSSILIQNSMNELIQSIQETNNNVESKLNLVNNTSMLILSNEILQDNLEENLEKGNLYLQTKIKRNIEEQIRNELRFNYAWDTKLLNSVYLVKEDDLDNYYGVSRYFQDSELIENRLRILSNYYGTRSNKVIVSPSYQNQSIYFIRNLESSNISKFKYNLTLEINENILSSSFDNLLKYKKAEQLIIDNNGVIVSHTDKKMLGLKVNPMFISLNNTSLTKELKIEDITYIASSQKFNDYNLTSIIILPKNLILSDFRSILSSYLIVVAMLIVIFLSIGISFSFKITKPINDLASNIFQIGQGNFEIKMPGYEEHELNQISDTFNTMTDKINELFNDIYKKQLLLKDAELKSLQSQINPHFLFNVLLSISWQAKMSGNEDVYKMVTSLSSLLRANIYLTGKEKITIKQEFEYINYYLFLQKTRFQDKIEFILPELSKEVEGYYLPKLAIQSMVENAVIHGLENKLGDGILKISLKTKNTSLYFIIEDNGIGFDSNIVHMDNSTHIGLYNVNKRIKLLYGDEYGISIESEINKGSKITVHIPIDKEVKGLNDL
jgi:two-component system, sensor histidine kinase YesM